MIDAQTSRPPFRFTFPATTIPIRVRWTGMQMDDTMRAEWTGTCPSQRSSALVASPIPPPVWQENVPGRVICSPVGIHPGPNPVPVPLPQGSAWVCASRASSGVLRGAAGRTSEIRGRLMGAFQWSE